MTRHRKLTQQLPPTPPPSLPNKQKLLSRKQRRHMRHRLRRKQRRLRIRARSMSTTTQIAVDALDMLHISSELDTKPLEFIERCQLTRHHALEMPIDQRPMIFFTEQKNDRILSSMKTYQLCDSIDDECYSSYV